MLPVFVSILKGTIKMKIVIKVGTSTLVDELIGEFRKDVFQSLCEQIAVMKGAKHQVVLVTSGACGLGKSELIEGGETELACDKAICATVGQSSLMELYKREFRKHRIVVGQTLLAGKQDYKKEMTGSTLNKSLESGLLQIVNANDAVYDEQMRIGDNDTLSAEVARIVKADKLVMVTDTDGFYKDFKNEKLRTLVTNAEAGEINGLYRHVDMDSGSKGGTGKMKTKLDAAKIATKSGVDTYIVSNCEMNNLSRLVEGDKSVVATYFEKAKKGSLQQFVEGLRAKISFNLR